jgi:hypothetical protein
MFSGTASQFRDEESVFRRKKTLFAGMKTMFSPVATMLWINVNRVLASRELVIERLGRVLSGENHVRCDRYMDL